MKTHFFNGTVAASLVVAAAVTGAAINASYGAGGGGAGGAGAGGGAAGTGTAPSGPAGQPYGTAPAGMPPEGTAPNGQQPYGTAPGGVQPYGSGPYIQPTNTAVPSNATPIVPGTTPPFNLNNSVAPTNGINPNTNLFMPYGNGLYRRGDEDGFLRGTNGFYRNRPNGEMEFIPDGGELYERQPDGQYYPSDVDDMRGIYRNGTLYSPRGLTNNVR